MQPCVRTIATCGKASGKAGPQCSGSLWASLPSARVSSLRSSKRSSIAGAGMREHIGSSSLKFERDVQQEQSEDVFFEITKIATRTPTKTIRLSNQLPRQLCCSSCIKRTAVDFGVQFCSAFCSTQSFQRLPGGELMTPEVGVSMHRQNSEGQISAFARLILAAKYLFCKGFCSIKASGGPSGASAGACSDVPPAEQPSCTAS